MKKIPFNIPLVVGTEEKYLKETLTNRKFSGDGPFTKKCSLWFEKELNVPKVLLTTSCTHALEMAAILLDIKKDDEIIMPSYTFVSTANAFVLRGAKIIFVDINPDTMNIDELKIEDAITNKTRAIVPVHYAGVACEMDIIMSLAKKYNLCVVEDAAQGMMAKYKGKPLGTIGHIGCFSFHETKNYNCGEGGLLILNDEKFVQRAEIIREKGTNRTQFLRGIGDKYRWIDLGSSYLPSEFNAAFLFAQLENVDEVNLKRLTLWNTYHKNLEFVSEIVLSRIPNDRTHNGHIFFIKLKNIDVRAKLISYLSSLDIQSVFHYIPLHESRDCSPYYEFRGKEEHTIKESERLLRLPLFYDLTISEVDSICNAIKEFFND